ncbi:MAG: anaerobic glycerol-3-phosphate dehydrogenase subunit GlpA [Bacillota bacterium]|uniref:Anaerobic glycerol-3-phosphate dehydrogenase subunit A n=1 Tax=Thermanaerosceptrum fracticalcis TaxID=1712410 RepID=A0A7G6E4F0_THEFR|nr:anaerobic glycerol-3-phosphate dehydrogenase subunit GlpA [Thermanaerosceptrum fracticalcis]QNB46954.1 anaerobic glycerol-3-phosphate dehydrogenase subunit A [Thermanaerosceptrum fracticalcis]
MADKYDVVIIGGGATGTGIVRDLAMRGLSCLLVEKEDLATGTSGRFHGLLHSGARYAVRDPHSAQECAQENRILKEIAANCLEDTGGYFIALKEDDPEYIRVWLEACRHGGIATQEISPAELLKQEPVLHKDIAKAYLVPDAAVDGFTLAAANALSAEKLGAKVKNYTRVVGFKREGQRIAGVFLRNVITGQEWEANCRLVINAAGAWAGQIGELAGVNLNIIPDKGVLIVFNHRITGKVLNRLRPPGDGDIFVPHGSVTIFGTTSRATDDPQDNQAAREDVLHLLKEGRKMIPDLEEMRLIRAFAGVRPLYQAGDQEGSGRQATRDFSLLDHEKLDGLRGFISVVGGKLTTYRLMAQAASDLAAQKLGNDKPCRTHLEPLADLGIERDKDRKHLCQCEMISKGMLEKAVEGKEQFSLSDIRRLTRLGMGPCQGTFCTYRATGFYHELKNLTAQEGNKLLKDHVQERWKGARPVLWGGQAQEIEINRGIYLSLLNLDRLDSGDYV